ncbi:MAG: VWA domain-containing protein [Spirochaetaceae bacterium]|nr:VWA domain-containing protein [Spirochaetaceae bacterium]
MPIRHGPPSRRPSAIWTRADPLALDRPLALLALVALAAVFAASRRGSRGGAVPVALSAWGGASVRAPAYPLRFARGLSAALFWGALLLATLAAAGPVRVQRTTVHLDRGTDIVFAVDTSPSMAALDLGTRSRLRGATAALRSFVERRPDDPIGLVSFGERAGLRSPVTYDHDYLTDRISRLRIMESGDGTAIGMGLSVAAAHLQSAGAEHGVIILITDGENTTGPIAPQAAAEAAARLGITIHTVGVGTDRPTVLEFTDPDTGAVRRGSYQGQPDARLLQALAERTGGRFAWAADAAGLQAALAEIDRAEVRERAGRPVLERTAAGRPFAIAALIGLLLHATLRRVWLREAL